MSLRYHILTLGCQMNLSDEERTRAVLDGMGFSWTDEEEEAHLLGIIACSVRQKAIDKVYARIHRWNRWKNKKVILTFVSGCMLPADKLKFLKQFDLVFTMNELPQLPDMIRQYGIVHPASLSRLESQVIHKTTAASSFPTLLDLAIRQGKLKIDELQPEGLSPDDRDVMDGLWKISPHYQSDYEAFVPIQNGCDKFCSFCAVPYTRGREVSRPSGEILEEVSGLIEKNYKSITLLGQNVNSYGLDKQGEELTFAALLEKIGEMGQSSGKEFWVYFTSPHPRDMGKDVIDTMARSPHLAKQIHLPMQSGDDRVLVKMNRKHTMEKYRELIHYVRNVLPQATLFTDIIVGFNGETEEQFENSRMAMQEFQFNMAYIAQYSSRPGAVSARWEDDVPTAEKKRRFHELNQELGTISHQLNQQMAGKTYRVLVTGYDRKPGFLSGHTEGKIIVRFRSDNHRLIGRFVDLHITSAADFSVAGELVNVKTLKV
jgi:tRNA-2-methylthio-N6-dimethylallyladenosine synthase